MKSKDTLHYLSLKNGKKLAYRLRNGDNSGPTVVFLGGYRSDMTGTKAAFLDKLAAKRGFPFLRFDYTGHGQSEGEFKDGCIGDWANDAREVIEATVKGDMILIGSSMGGWIGLLLAQTLGNRIKGFIGIAAAPDFSNWVWNHEMSEDMRTLCTKQGYIAAPDGEIFTHKLFTDGAQHLVLNKPLHLNCPVTLLHGKLDNVVPYSVAEKLAKHITSPTAPDIILIDDGDHRLARDEDLLILTGITQRYIDITPMD